MFTDFYYTLRKKGVPVTVTEWLSFIEALYKGYFQSSLNHLYYIGRAFLIKMLSAMVWFSMRKGRK